MEPDDVDLTVMPMHLTDTDAIEISEFIQEYKATGKGKPIEVKISVDSQQELEFLLTLFRRLNLKWTFPR